MQMSDSNNNDYVSTYDVIRDGHFYLKNGTARSLPILPITIEDDESQDGSVESLANSVGYGSSEDDCAFISNDVTPEKTPAMRPGRSRNNSTNLRYSRSRSRSGSQRSIQNGRTNASSRSRARQQARAKRRSRLGSGSDVIDDIIDENEVANYQRSRSNPPAISREEQKSRLQRRRSAVTFPSTYRTLSAPARYIPVRPSLGSLIMSTTPSVTSVASGVETCCYGNPFPRNNYRSSRNGNWSNLMTCLAHKKEHGVRMTQTQILIRKSLEKAIQKAGYNMNELDLNSPCSSPMVGRKSEPKCHVDWGEAAVIGEHVWAPTSVSGDLCYVGEHNCTKSGPRKKCSACHIVVHETCMEQLDKIGFQCKVTFREASTRNLRENLTVRHHWVHRRKQDGKCRQCGKVFEKRFGFRDSKILAISCSWCKEAYHNKVSCFRMQKINESCSLGAHARIIVPPTWIVKWTPRGKSLRNRSKKKRATSGMWRKKSSKDGKQKLFVIRPLPEHTPYLTPTLVFINPKSGGNQGVKILQTFQWLLNQRQVFNLCEGGPKEALEMFRKVPNLRILACGGDGTVGWILSILDELNMSRSPPIAVLPLGTGNDLSRTLNWGPGYTDEPICKILQHVEEGRVVQLDRWKLKVRPNEGVKHTDGEDGTDNEGTAADHLPLDVVNNYFSMGADAKVSLEFHESREAHPGKFNSRFGNKFFYARAGVSGYLTSKQKNLGKILTLVCDGRDITPKIQAIKPVCIVFLNIPRYSAGTMPWGNPTGSEFQPQLHDDKLIEVLAFTSNQLGMIFVGGHGERLCQCREAVVTTNRSIPVQIDGEPCMLNPSIIELKFHNQANMLYKTKHGRGSIPLIPEHPVSEQLKICINLISLEHYEKYNGEKVKLRELSRPSHATVVPADADLEAVRLSIERLQQQNSTPLENLTEHFTFLDLSSSERFYRIDRTQESLHLVREVAGTDGELFVLDSSPKAKSKQKNDADYSGFPRSRQVEKSTGSRKRISSDTTGTSTGTPVINDRGPLRSPGPISMLKEETIPDFVNETVQIKIVNYEEGAPSATSDVTNDTLGKKSNDGKLSNGNVINYEAKKSGKSDIKAIGEESQNEAPLPSRGGKPPKPAKSNSLPSGLSPSEVKKQFKKRPLSCTSADHDVIIADNSSKTTHCDITKGDSLASVFSSPSSSNSPKKNQDSESALWNDATSSTSMSSAEYLVITEDVHPATSSTDPTSSNPEISTAIVTSFSNVMSTSIVTSSIQDMSEITITSSNSPNDVGTGSALEKSPSISSSSRSLGSRKSSHESVSSRDSPKSPTASPILKITNHDGFETPVVHGAKDESSEIVACEEPSTPEIEFMSKQLSRNNNSRSNGTIISSLPKRDPNKKTRANTSGMPLSIFVKTQEPPPIQKLPQRTKTVRDKSLSPERDQQHIPLKEFVSNLKDVPYNDEISTVNDSDQSNILSSTNQPIADKRGNKQPIINDHDERLKPVVTKHEPVTPQNSLDTALPAIGIQANLATSVASVLSNRPDGKRYSDDVISTDSEISVEGVVLNQPTNGPNQSELVNGNQSNNIGGALDENKNILNKQYWDSSKRGDVDKLKQSLESGADATSIDADGSTALHNAARFNHYDIVELLIEKGPPELLNMKDRDRRQTALHKAAWFGHSKVCELLVNAGASITLTDYKGMTPVERARQAEDTKLEQFLSQAALKRMEVDG